MIPYSYYSILSIGLLSSPIPNTESLLVQLQHSFGVNPRYSNFFEHLKAEQEKTVSSLWDMEVRAPKRKKQCKASIYKEQIKTAVNNKYKLSDLGEQIQNIAT
ncbi:hypothetical protein DSO57_1026655, partial [Entomophthora muscae]